ncbi:hypothetical protein Scep_016954 [Stephania cephalantha]|uniref:Uncharacterized protein n=1 Tax=Stephania cephalantha TaxID=152367 RepID=A0AAP0IQG3_9MAGN
MEASNSLKILEQCRISPPPCSLAPKSLPLTFLDLLWLTCPNVQHILFYNYTQPSAHFTHHVLPTIKHSLSLALSRFPFLSGHLSWPPHSNNPSITYTHTDSVAVTVAQSALNFHHHVADYARDALQFHSLVPHLPCSETDSPVFSLQVTLFPNTGFSIGFAINHGVADGSTAHQFLSYWAEICKSDRCRSSKLPEPFYDRSVIRDPDGLEQIYLEDLKQFRGSLKSLRAREGSPFGGSSEDFVRETFVVTKTHVQRLEHWLSKLLQEKNMSKFYTSTFVLVLAYALVCLVKARGEEMKKKVQIGFATGCRTRLGYPIPKTYFGNCIGVCWTRAMESESIRERDGFLWASEAIGTSISDLEHGVLRGAEKWVKNSVVVPDGESTERVMIAGTLKLNFYDVDFGFGRPRKSEVISNEKKGGISLSESRDDGGVEIGLALKKHAMAQFSSLFVNGLKALDERVSTDFM